MPRLACRLALLMLALVLAQPAAASVSVNQLFVRTSDEARLRAAVQTYLAGWAERPDTRGSAWWQPGAGGRRVVLLPPRKGWATVLETGQAAPDPTLAEVLSQALGTRVVWLQVLGSSLSYRSVILEKGKIVGTGAEPIPGWGAEPLDGPMPQYRDVEQVGWELLEKEGVPRAYRYLTQQDVAVAKDPKKGPQATVYKVVAEGEKLVVGEGRFGFVLPPRGARPPVAMDTTLPILDDDGKSIEQGVDLVRLTGTPTPERVAQLGRTLNRVRRRYAAQLQKPFCHLVPDAYRIPVYTHLAKEQGPCRSVYRKLLSRAQAEAAEPDKASRPVEHQAP